MASLYRGHSTKISATPLSQFCRISCLLVRDVSAHISSTLGMAQMNVSATFFSGRTHHPAVLTTHRQTDRILKVFWSKSVCFLWQTQNSTPWPVCVYGRVL